MRAGLVGAGDRELAKARVVGNVFHPIGGAERYVGFMAVTRVWDGHYILYFDFILGPYQTWSF